jgi:hypothetical protein
MLVYCVSYLISSYVLGVYMDITPKVHVLYTARRHFVWVARGIFLPNVARAWPSAMRQLNVADYVMVKAGSVYTTPQPVEVHHLLEKMERNESYIYWLQPKHGGLESQFASINVNGRFFHLNSKLEKAIFRNVRLTKNFQNFEVLADGTKKLRIPARLLREKIRTSVRAEGSVGAASPGASPGAALGTALGTAPGTALGTAPGTALGTAPGTAASPGGSPRSAASPGGSPRSAASPGGSPRSAERRAGRNLLYLTRGGAQHMEPAAKRARTYARRGKRRSPSFSDVSGLFAAVRTLPVVDTLVPSREEYEQQLREILRAEFPSSFTCAVPHAEADASDL